MPKVEFTYFLERTWKFGQKPLVKAYMSQLRQVYKGLLDFSAIDEKTEETKNQNPMISQNQSVSEEFKKPDSVKKSVTKATTLPDVPTEIMRPTKPANVDPEEAELERQLRENEEAQEFEFNDENDEYLQGSQISKVRIDAEIKGTDGLEKKHNLENKPEQEITKKYKMDENNNELK